MKRLILFVMCIFASMYASAQNNEPRLRISPNGFVLMSKHAPLLVTVLYRGVNDIKWSGENVGVDTKFKMNIPSYHNEVKGKKVRRNVNEKRYYVTVSDYGAAKVEFSGVTDNGDVLKETLIIAAGDRDNPNLRLDVPFEIVKTRDSYSLKLTVGDNVKHVMVCLQGQDKYYYEKVSHGSVKFKLDLSDINAKTLVYIVAFDADNNTALYETNVVVK